MAIPNPDDFMVAVAGSDVNPTTHLEWMNAQHFREIDTLTSGAALTIPADVMQVVVRGGTAVGDASAGMRLRYDAAVDATYVTANPTTSFVDFVGRGFRATDDWVEGVSVKSKALLLKSAALDPIMIDMHYGLMRGMGWQATDPGNPSNSPIILDVSSSTTTTITLTSGGASLGGAKLVAYLASDDEYYSASVHDITGNVITLTHTLDATPVQVANFWRDSVHPNEWGFYAMADLALREKLTRDLLAKHFPREGWKGVGTETLTVETTGGYAIPGASAVGWRALKVEGTAAYGGVELLLERCGSAGTYEVELILNAGVRTPDTVNTVTVQAGELYENDTTGPSITATQRITGHGGVQRVRIPFRKSPGTRMVLRVLSANAGPWEFWVGMCHVYRTTGALMSFDTGKHVLLGDSFFAGLQFENRLKARLPNAEIINEGVSGNTTAQMLARFNDDVRPHAPNFLWITGGINDLYAARSYRDVAVDLNTIIAAGTNLKAQVITFNIPVGDAEDSKLEASRIYAAAHGFVSGDAPDRVGTFQNLNDGIDLNTSDVTKLWVSPTKTPTFYIIDSLEIDVTTPTLVDLFLYYSDNPLGVGTDDSNAAIKVSDLTLPHRVPKDNLISRYCVIAARVASGGATDNIKFNGSVRW